MHRRCHSRGILLEDDVAERKLDIIQESSERPLRQVVAWTSSCREPALELILANAHDRFTWDGG